MAHTHDHGHHHRGEGRTVGRLWISIILNFIITLAEFVGGIISGSLSLLSDALHNLNDTASLGISLVARKISKKDANREKTFGYQRAEVIGAFINLVTLVIIALYLVKEGIERFLLSPANRRYGDVYSSCRGPARQPDNRSAASPKLQGKYQYQKRLCSYFI